jgi:hypothetical protein
MDEPLWGQIRNFGGFATLIFDLVRSVCAYGAVVAECAR